MAKGDFVAHLWEKMGAIFVRKRREKEVKVKVKAKERIIEGDSEGGREIHWHYFVPNVRKQRIF